MLGRVVGSACLLLAAACSPEPFLADLPPVPGSSALLFATTRVDEEQARVTVTAHEITESTRRPIVLADEAEVPNGVEHSFFAAWLPGSLAEHSLEPGEVYPRVGAAQRSFAELATEGRFFVTDTSAEASGSAFREVETLPSALADLSLGVRSRCVGLASGRAITLPTRAVPSFAVELGDGSVLLGVEPIYGESRPRFFHLDPEAELREIDLSNFPDFESGYRSADGGLWFVTPRLELWRATSVRTVTATASALVGAERIFTPSSLPRFPAVCADGEASRYEGAPRIIADLAVVARGRTVEAYFVLDRDGGLLVQDGSQMVCPYRALVRDGGVHLTLIATDRETAWFASDSDTKLYRYSSGEVEAFEIFGPGLFVTTVAELPHLGLIATTTGQLARYSGGLWLPSETPDVSRPVALIEVEHPWANEYGLFMGGDFGKAGEWWPGEPRVCPDRTEGVAPSGINHLVPFGDGVLFVAQATGSYSGTSVVVWVRPQDYAAQ